MAVLAKYQARAPDCRSAKDRDFLLASDAEEAWGAKAHPAEVHQVPAQRRRDELRMVACLPEPQARSAALSARLDEVRARQGESVSGQLPALPVSLLPVRLEALERGQAPELSAQLSARVRLPLAVRPQEQKAQAVWPRAPGVQQPALPVWPPEAPHWLALLAQEQPASSAQLWLLLL